MAQWLELGASLALILFSSIVLPYLRRRLSSQEASAVLADLERVTAPAVLAAEQTVASRLRWIAPEVGTLTPDQAQEALADAQQRIATGHSALLDRAASALKLDEAKLQELVKTLIEAEVRRRKEALDK